MDRIGYPVTVLNAGKENNMDISKYKVGMKLRGVSGSIWKVISIPDTELVEC